MPETRACLVLVTQAQLLPDNHCALWVFLVTCNMKMATRRTIWKHAIHAVGWLLNAFSVKHLKSAYLQCGLMPLDFRSYMERMPAWTKHVTDEDVDHVESKLPELISLGRKQNGLFSNDVLTALGSDWLLKWETDHLPDVARKELIEARIHYTPDDKSPLNRQGTLLLTGENSKRLRKEAAEARIRRVEEQRTAKEQQAARKEEERAAVEDKAIAVRIMYPEVLEVEDIKHLKKDFIEAVVHTYWEEVRKHHVDNGVNVNLPTLVGDMTKDQLLEYAIIILRDPGVLGDPEEERNNEHIDQHCNTLAKKNLRIETKALQEEAAKEKKGRKRQREEAQAAGVESVAAVSSRGRNVTRFSMA